jgi:hypothetical protein
MQTIMYPSESTYKTARIWTRDMIEGAPVLRAAQPRHQDGTRCDILIHIDPALPCPPNIPPDLWTTEISTQEPPKNAIFVL